MVVYALIVIVLGVSSLFLFEGKTNVSVGGINVGKTIQFVKSFVTNDD